MDWKEDVEALIVAIVKEFSDALMAHRKAKREEPPVILCETQLQVMRALDAMKKWWFEVCQAAEPEQRVFMEKIYMREITRMLGEVAA